MKEPTTFVTGSDDNTIRLYDLRMRDIICCLQDHKNVDGITSLVTS